MANLTTKIESLISNWCDVEAGSYEATATLRSLWSRRHPVSPPYETNGAPSLVNKIHSKFEGCPDAQEISVGYFLLGGGIQTVSDLHDFLTPCA